MTREEAINVVRVLTESTYFDDRELEGLRTLIPELRESEDERIRVRDFMMKQFFRPISPDLADALADAIIKVEKTALNKKQKESLHISETCKENPDSLTLEEAAKAYENSLDYHHYTGDNPSVAFIAGAKWQKEQMMKEAVEGEIMTNGLYPYEPRIVASYPDCPYQLGDKVKLIIVKEEGE